ncbi:MAG: AI-2E family transporter [Anaerolineales bacterium]|nr:AI-2E family transporter [Anaerolineales bacterium]
MSQIAPQPAADPPASPRWNTPTKFLVALVIFLLVGSLLAQFSGLAGPVIFCAILTYLLSPLVEALSRRFRLAWHVSVNLTYAGLVVAIVAVLTVAGIAIEQQIVGLYNTVVEISADLPGFVETNVLNRSFTIGPFVIAPANLDFQPLYDQLIAAIQPALSQTGSLVGSIASGTATVLGWFLLILLVSYYLMHDLQRLLPGLERAMPAGYAYDVRRLAAELGPIWNAYLRGQVTLALIIGAMVGVTMTFLGVRYGPVLGLVSVMAEFIPYVGPTLSALIGALIGLFQGGNWLGLSPVVYALLILGMYTLLQQIQGNVFYPRIMGSSLGLHPAVILFGAIVMAQLLGFVGLLLAAPLLATVKLFGRYLYCKLFDLDPWPEPPAPPPPPKAVEWPRWLRRLWPGQPRKSA